MDIYMDNLNITGTNTDIMARFRNIENDIENDTRPKIIGTIISEGSSGYILNNPRLPLKGEYTDDSFIQSLCSNKEVCKIFHFQNIYNKEISFYSSDFPFDYFAKYLVLPISWGKIDWDIIINSQYNLKYLFEKIEAYLPKEIYSNAIIFPEGTSIYILKSNIFVNKFINIVKCIYKLSKCNYFYPDLKLANIIMIQDYSKFTIKLIDYTSIQSIILDNLDSCLKNLFDYENEGVFCNNHDYPIFPSIPYFFLRGQFLSKNKNILNQLEELRTHLEHLVTSNLFSRIENIKYILSFSKFTEIPEFSFDIELTNIITKNNHLININQINFVSIIDQIYKEKLGYRLDEEDEFLIFYDDSDDSDDSENHYENKLLKLGLTKERRLDQIDKYILLYNNYINEMIRRNSIDITLEDDLNLLIKMMFDKIELYSLGITIFEYLSNYYSKILPDENFSKLVKIGILCTITILEYEGQILYSNYNLDDIYLEYKKII